MILPQADRLHRASPEPSQPRSNPTSVEYSKQKIGSRQLTEGEQHCVPSHDARAPRFGSAATCCGAVLLLAAPVLLALVRESARRRGAGWRRACPRLACSDHGLDATATRRSSDARQRRRPAGVEVLRVGQGSSVDEMPPWRTM